MRGEKDALPGDYRKDTVRISQTSFVPPDAVHIGTLIETMFNELSGKNFLERPVIYQASYAHALFVSIHPFKDGNGRVARLIVNYVFWKNGLPGILLPWENRDRYYDALEECNTNELSMRGDLTELTTLFCDLFEESLDFIKHNAVSEEIVSEEIESADVIARIPTEEIGPVIDSKSAGTRLSSLLSRISSTKVAISIEEQYINWANSFGRFLSDLREGADRTSRAFREAWSGEVRLKEYDLIEQDVYFAIRQRRSFSRTWLVQMIMSLPKSREELVFYFGSNSYAARQLDPSLGYTASLHVSRYSADAAQHVSVNKESWSRVREFVHNGSELGVVVSDADGSLQLIYQHEQAFEDWFPMMIEDVLLNLGKMKL